MCHEQYDKLYTRGSYAVFEDVLDRLVDLSPQGGTCMMGGKVDEEQVVQFASLAKNAGNAYFKQSRFDLAVTSYTQALTHMEKLDHPHPFSATLLNNRALCVSRPALP